MEDTDNVGGVMTRGYKVEILADHETGQRRQSDHRRRVDNGLDECGDTEPRQEAIEK
jgi:hypothetical protein